MHNFITIGISCDNARTTSIITKHLSTSHSISSTSFTSAAGYSAAKAVGSAMDAGDAGIAIVGIDSEAVAAQVRAAGGAILHITTPQEYFKLTRRSGDDVLFDYGSRSLLLEEIDEIITRKVLAIQRYRQAA